MKFISPHISYAEAIRSDAAKRAGINNYFTLEQLTRMTVLANKVFEPLRTHFKVPIFIASFFRNPEVNKLIGGAKNSQHMANNGAAIDIDAEVFGGITNKDIFNYIKDNLEFDQLIAEGLSENSLEPQWIHCSYTSPELNRKNILVHESMAGSNKYYEYNNEKGLDIRSYR